MYNTEDDASDTEEIDLPFSDTPWLHHADILIEHIPEDAKKIILIGRNLCMVTLKIKAARPNIRIFSLLDSLALKNKASDAAEEAGYGDDLSFRVQRLDAFRKSIRCGATARVSTLDKYDVVLLAPVPHKSTLCKYTNSALMRLLSVVSDVMTDDGRLIVIDRMYPNSYLKKRCPDSIVQKIVGGKHNAMFDAYMKALIDNPGISSRHVRKGEYSLCNVVQFLLALSDIDFDAARQCKHYCQAVAENTYKDLLKVLRMRILHHKLYTTSTFDKVIQREFDFSKEELETLLSTGIFVAEYIQHSN